MKHKWAKPAKLNTFLKKHKGSDLALLPDFVRPRDPVAVLIHSWLLWEASTEQAEVAMRKLLPYYCSPRWNSGLQMFCVVPLLVPG